MKLAEKFKLNRKREREREREKLGMIEIVTEKEEANGRVGERGRNRKR